MSRLNIPRRSFLQAPSSIGLPRLAAAALAIALGASVLSGASMAGTATEPTVKPTMNFVGTFAAAPEETTGPRSSLLEMIRQAYVADRSDTVIEPAAARFTTGASTRALAADPEVPAELDDSDMVPGSLVDDVSDPFEPVNRVIFGFNEIVDFLVLRPVSHAYRAVVPQPLRTGVSNALHNFSTPIIFANDLLQGRPERAKTTAVRFLVNSTAGFGGLVDAAAAAGLPSHSEDFGQTLAVWGARPGAYIILPVLGPSTVRDTVGMAVDTALHPATWLMWDLSFVERSAPIMAYTVSAHESVLDEAEALRTTSPDFYATVRDIYAQRRASAITNGGFDGGFVDGVADDGFGEGGLSDDAFESLPPIPTE
jgi:phospholipid-binding lipoprotein MlaA